MEANYRSVEFFLRANFLRANNFLTNENITMKFNTLYIYAVVNVLPNYQIFILD